MICVMIVAVMGGMVLGQPADSPVSQSELAAPSDQAATPKAQPQQPSSPAPSQQDDAIRPAEAPAPAPTNATQQPKPSKTPPLSKPSAPSKPTTHGKRVAAFWLIVPGK